MQLATVEFARHVLGYEGAHSAGIRSKYTISNYRFITRTKDIEDLGGTLRLGLYPCHIKEGTLAKIYNKNDIEERHRHRYEFNNEFREQLESNGMVFSGTSPDGRLVEIIEIPKMISLLHVNSILNSYQDLIVHSLYLNHFVEAALNYQQK